LRLIYHLIIHFAGFLLKGLAPFNQKLKLFVDGRKNVLETLAKNIAENDKTIWFHCASLGEYEQGLPLLEELKISYPEYKLVLSFFSPSGYELKKNSEAADLVVYLPLDTKKNAVAFLDLVHPSLVVFVKYEFWPNYLREIKKRQIKLISVSTIFRKQQAFFKWYGDWMRKSLNAFDHFFVQNEASLKLLNSIKITNATLSGDTRFDRVAQILKRDNSLLFIERFKGNTPCLVAGSTWPEDESLLIKYINQAAPNTLKYIIAPHTIKPKKIKELQQKITKKTILFSEKEGANLEDFEVLIVDTIGILSKIFSYATIAYIGGGMGTTGLHNTLEPATFGIPILIGKNYDKFKEVKDLVALGGIQSINDQDSFSKSLDIIMQDKDLYDHMATINKDYVQKNTGVVIQILDYIRTIL
jgi:3-deoxy-D-manno-octulosonic-acid transferase